MAGLEAGGRVLRRRLEEAVSLLLQIEKTVAEGAGAAGLAALMAFKDRFRGRTVGIVICGGNIDTRLLANVLLRDLARSGIRVCAIAPVMGETGLLQTFMGVEDTPENRARFIATIPWGRMSRPEDIANAAVFLASDEAEMVTGAVLEVDGGRCV